MNKMMLHHPKGVIEIDAFLQLIWSTFQFSAVEPRILHKVDAYPWAGNFWEFRCVTKNVSWVLNIFILRVHFQAECSSDVEIFLLSMCFTCFTGSDEGWQWSMQVFDWAIAKKKADRTTPTMMHVSNSTCLRLYIRLQMERSFKSADIIKHYSPLCFKHGIVNLCGRGRNPDR